MLVKCKICGNKIDRNTAYKVVVNDKNNYFCNEYEYMKDKEEKRCRVKIFGVITDIFNYEIKNSVLNKEISDIAKIHTYSVLYQFLLDNKDRIFRILDNKSFTSEYAKVKYFSAIIKNQIASYKKNIKVEHEKKVYIDVVKISYKPKKQKKSIDEYMEGYNE